jgi:hypothetical protein
MLLNSCYISTILIHAQSKQTITLPFETVHQEAEQEEVISLSEILYSTNKLK